ncbi:PYDC1 isoform 1 [Pan troglodytes]|uniref:Pyrin domain-containing protein 1 n=5 Tax=Homininae TaxID=207598 RepID=PYDC1_HUMAN|nr:pyrin domain-containing protein 1 [Homo sapiens]XP_001158748.1 pyrin domain-containing protein 1 [Pan troglodytes]XP_003807545.1 pyrin domain-containing protein 1 [Pan paniscus]Q8WXC3.1 RecName: Full=Pyrin domain-containing protein 1; AltName: Full=PAAD-only protein 1; AltName: Full=Pyrin-only protein 1; AltName: Full=cellular POP1; Short=cPOP1 [Homo sapiens]2HM2_Q Chain Q, Pyrin-only protein 1 [Homo sapiens]AAI05034.1 PYD (pyrin domain) containing 1 [Homo sapiens]AAI05036.1 Pyrin domain c|eukprot:NP_690865.1 pyrin domain-containing protein 1 [Homo sapiens]
MGTKREAILKVLENLTPEELKKFKMKLGTVPLREGFERIPRGALGQLDIVDLTDKLVASYYEDYAAELVVAVLRDMRMLEEAARLQRAA